MIDKNRILKRKLFFALIAIIVIMPFVFVWLKYGYIDKNKPQEEIDKQINLDEDLMASSDGFIYNKELHKNSVEIPYDVRYMKMSKNGKMLFTYGHNKGGISIIDISNPNKIKLAGLFAFEKGEFQLDLIDVEDTKDGNLLYVANPNEGILKLDISNPSKITLLETYKLDTKPFKIIMSDNERIIFTKTANGQVLAINSASKPFKMSKKDAIYDMREPFVPYIINAGDMAVLSENELLVASMKGIYVINTAEYSIELKYPFKNGEPTPENIVISKDKKRLYAMTCWFDINTYDISNLDKIEHINNMNFTHSISNIFDIDEKEKKMMIGKYARKDGSSFSGFVFFDISQEYEPQPIKNYDTPENHKINAIFTNDKKYIAVSFHRRKEIYVSLFKRPQ